MQTLIIHGRQPEIGRAELESLYGAENLTPVGLTATLIDRDPQTIDFMRLGGMVKFCKVLTELETTKWDKIEKFLLEVAPNHFQYLPEGKLKIGFSVYDINTNPRRIQATALKLKKQGKHQNRSIRIIPNKELVLNSATVLNNKLTQQLGWELVFVRNSTKTIVAQSIAVQDIDKYAARDRERPYRDSKVGMLPPKLAQTIINLSVGKLGDDGIPVCGPRQSTGFTVLDPFCGTGVTLQEAALMGYTVYGSDLDARMIEYTEKNLVWLTEEYQARVFDNYVEQADATNHKWEKHFDTIACETYLGRPLSSAPDHQALKKIVSDCDTIHKKFLQNIASQTKSGFRMCLAVPSWKAKNGFIHMPTLDNLDKLGYNQLKFAHSSAECLIYHRQGQIVARELVVLVRK